MRWLLCLLVAVQPWWLWPNLFLDTSTRLTLIGLLFAAALCAMARPISRGLPVAWVAWALAFVVSVGWAGFFVMSSGAYFEHFLETAALCDGLLVALASVLGLWAFSQARTEDFRCMRWVGFLFLLTNLAVAGWQVVHHAPRVMGLFEADRLLAAYALAWLPVCWVWHPVIALVPIAILALTHKPVVLIIGVAALLWRVKGWRWGATIATLACGAWCVAGPQAFGLRWSQRGLTWLHAGQAVLDRPFGQGFSPMVLSKIETQYGYLLPSLHSDWLMLAVGSGIVVTGWALWLWGRMCWQQPVTQTAAALQHGLWALGCVSFAQSTVSHAAVSGLALVFLAWWLVEQRQEISHG